MRLNDKIVERKMRGHSFSTAENVFLLMTKSVISNILIVIIVYFRVC